MILTSGNVSLSPEHKHYIYVIFHKFMDLLKRGIIKNTSIHSVKFQRYIESNRFWRQFRSRMPGMTYGL
jgi:hypothetical protein